MDNKKGKQKEKMRRKINTEKIIRTMIKRGKQV